MLVALHILPRTCEDLLRDIFGILLPPHLHKDESVDFREVLVVELAKGNAVAGLRFLNEQLFFVFHI